MRSNSNIKYPRNRSEAIQIINLLDLQWRIGATVNDKKAVLEFAKKAFELAQEQSLDGVCHELKRWVRRRKIPVRL